MEIVKSFNFDGLDVDVYETQEGNDVFVQGEYVETLCNGYTKHDVVQVTNIYCNNNWNLPQ